MESGLMLSAMPSKPVSRKSGWSSRGAHATRSAAEGVMLNKDRASNFGVRTVDLERDRSKAKGVMSSLIESRGVRSLRLGSFAALPLL
jgi:hypothetical protein